jgi:hypothetical protein
MYWLAGVHITFVVSTLILALADRFSRTRPGGGDVEGV